MTHSRRGFIGLALATAAAVSARHESSGGSAMRNVLPLSASKFADAIGVCTHPNWRNSVWGSSGWPAALLETGVLHTRTRIGSGANGQAAVDQLRGFFDRGGKLSALVTGIGADFDLRQISADIDFLGSQVGARQLSGIEGPNEYNNPSRRPSDWAARLRAFEQWLHQRVRRDPKLAGVPLVAPSIWGRIPRDYRALGDLGQYVDKGCLHYYTGGRRPTRSGPGTLSSELGGLFEYSLGDAISDAQGVAPGKPVWMTEFGFPVNGPGQPLSSFTISEGAAAKYLLRGLLDVYAQGVERIFIYSLIDDVRSPPRYHGLMDKNLRRRPAFHALGNLMALMHDPGRDPFVPAPLGYSLTPNSGVQQQLFQKRDGTYLLALYQDVDSFDRVRLVDTAVAKRLVEVRLGSRAAQVALFVPTIDLLPRQKLSGVQALTVPVSDYLTVLQITPEHA